MAIDFSLSPELEAIRMRVRTFVNDVIKPEERRIEGGVGDILVLSPTLADGTVVSKDDGPRAGVTYDAIAGLDRRRIWTLATLELAAILEQLANGVGNADFLRAKIVTARFYADHILNKAPGLRDSIVEGADSVTELALDAF